MKCPRCSSLCHFEEFTPGEFTVSCSLCGFHSSQTIESYCEGVPVFGAITNNPLGVIVTPNGNIPYYSERKRDTLLSANDTKGYTFFNGLNWCYKPKDSVEIVQLNPEKMMELIY